MRELPQCLSHTESFNYTDDSALLNVFGHNSHRRKEFLGQAQKNKAWPAPIYSFNSFPRRARKEKEAKAKEREAKKSKKDRKEDGEI